MDIVKVMSGANITNDPIFGEGGFFGGAPGGTTFAGIGPANINVQRDGIPTNDVRSNPQRANCSVY